MLILHASPPTDPAIVRKPGVIAKDGVELLPQHMIQAAIVIQLPCEIVKEVLVSNMDCVYGKASLTIVAATKDNAQAGLPGFGKGPWTSRKLNVGENSSRYTAWCFCPTLTSN